MRLYITAAIVSLIGLADAIYLTVEHVTGQSVRCTIIAGCSEVLSSRYAVVAGLPLAAVGAAAYFSVFSLATLAAFGYRVAGTLMTALVFLMFDRVFGTTFYTLVGFHGLHVTIGVIAMLIFLFLSLGREISEQQRTGVEMVGWYWHFVDAVWIVVFLVVYVASRSGTT